MNKPTPDAYALFITIGFADGEFIFGEDGEHPAYGTLAADLTAAPDGWTIARTYLGSQGEDGNFHELSGPVAEKAKRLLLDSDDFNDWANRHCRGLEDSARVDAMRDRYDFGADLASHLARMNEYA